jgi:hypothetical protein
MSKKIDELITNAGLAISNSLQNDKLQQMLVVFCYTTEELGEGKALLENAVTLNTRHQKEYGEQFQATEEVRGKIEEACGPYITFIKIARVAFAKEPGAWTALGLSGERKESYSRLLAQFNQFYTNLKGNEQWLAKIAVYGITTEKLDAGEALANEVEDALNIQKVETGEAQEATRLRDKAADTLQEWYSDFIAIARIALEDKPQYLEMLRIVKK